MNEKQRKNLLQLSVSVNGRENLPMKGMASNRMSELSEFAKELAKHKRFEEESRFLCVPRRYEEERIFSPPRMETAYRQHHYAAAVPQMPLTMPIPSEPIYSAGPPPRANNLSSSSHPQNQFVLQKQLDGMMDEMNTLKQRAGAQLRRNQTATSPLMPFKIESRTSAEEDLDRIHMKCNGLENAIESMQKQLIIQQEMMKEQREHLKNIQKIEKQPEHGAGSFSGGQRLERQHDNDTRPSQQEWTDTSWLESARGKAWLGNKLFMWLETPSVKRLLNEMIEIMVLEHVSKALASSGDDEARNHASNIKKILKGLERKISTRVSDRLQDSDPTRDIGPLFTTTSKSTETDQPTGEDKTLNKETKKTTTTITSKEVLQEQEGKPVFDKQQKTIEAEAWPTDTSLTSTERGYDQCVDSPTVSSVSDVSLSSHVNKCIGKLVKRTEGLDSAYRYITILKALWDRFPELHDTRSYEAAGRIVHDSIAISESDKMRPKRSHASGRGKKKKESIQAEKQIHAERDWVSLNETDHAIKPTSDVSAYAFIGNTQENRSKVVKKQSRRHRKNH